MCPSETERIPYFLIDSSKIKHQPKRRKIQVDRLYRRKYEESERKKIKLKNLKLYLENKTIIEENEKLRRKANLLHQENLALLSEYQKKFPISLNQSSYLH